MKKEYIIFGIIWAIGSLLELVGWLDPLRAYGQMVAAPVSTFNAQMIQKLQAPYGAIVFLMTKAEYLQQLEVQYARALVDLAELDALRLENAELKRVLSVGDRRTNQTTILGAPIVSLAYPAVGVGANDGVSENDMVLIDGVLVGTIEAVTEYQSRVSLLSTKRKTKILARTESGVEGVIDGDGRSVFLTHIPRSAQLQQGEKIVTLGQEGIEKNILIGTVHRIEQEPSDATQTVAVLQLVSFYEAILVEVQ